MSQFGGDFVGARLQLLLVMERVAAVQRFRAGSRAILAPDVTAGVCKREA
ncbi:MAG: hypothetical protein RML85_06255 [Acidobacteriota bacterium]|nr:hypothetical protein [Acidobacteriota bacterium]